MHAHDSDLHVTLAGRGLNGKTAKIFFETGVKLLGLKNFQMFEEMNSELGNLGNIFLTKNLGNHHASI